MVCAKWPSQEEAGHWRDLKPAEYHDLGSWYESASAGCHGCRVVYDAALAICIKDKLGSEAKVAVDVGILYRTKDYNIQLNMKIGDDRVNYVYLYTDSDEVTQDWPLVEKVEKLQSKFFFKRGLEHAKIWLDHCLETHPNCGSSDNKTPFPTRLVAVGSSSRRPYLYESKPDETGFYSTLSYCWGIKGKVTASITTKDNLNTRKDGFLLEELPRTCQDAISVSRTLGIPYIWIDQLCIVQDDEKDWEIESAKMCSIYANSLLTLAALDSPASDTGLFTADASENLMRRNAMVKVTHPTSGAESFVYMQRCMEQGHFPFLHSRHDQHSLKLAGRHTYLETRLWTLQEIALSPRILWFANDDLGWSCRQATACECRPNPSSAGFEELPSHIAVNLTLIKQEPREWLPIWYRYVEQATQRLFTKKNDRLPALAGLAGAMQPHLGGRYVAGHWTNDIEMSLMWEFIQEEKIRYRSSEPILPMEQDYAPTWSWASVSLPIIHHSPEVPAMVEQGMEYKVLSIDFTPTTLNVWGPGMGVLLVKGVVLDVTLPVREVRILRRSYVDLEHKTEGNKILFLTKGCKPDPRGQNLVAGGDYCMLIQLRWPQDMGDGTTGVIFGLVLEKVSREETTGWEKRFRDRVSSGGTHIHINTEHDTAKDPVADSPAMSSGNGNLGHDVFRRVGFMDMFFEIKGFAWEEVAVEHERTIQII